MSQYKDPDTSDNHADIEQLVLFLDILGRVCTKLHFQLYDARPDYPEVTG